MFFFLESNIKYNNVGLVGYITFPFCRSTLTHKIFQLALIKLFFCIFFY